jgi:hypothetical protein
MNHTSEATDGDGRRIRLSKVPEYLIYENETSTAWNLRTLLLLQRSGFLRLRLEAPPQRDPGESDEAWDARSENEWRQQRETRVVEVLESLAGTDAWDRVDQVRDAASRRGLSGLEALRNAIAAGSAPGLCAAFAHEYSFKRGAVSEFPELRVQVASACGGCPACRELGSPPNPGFQPDPGPPNVKDPVRPSVAALVADVSRTLIVLVDSPDAQRTTRRLLRTLRRLIALGVSMVVAPPKTLKALEDAAAARPLVTASVWEPTALPDLTTAVVAVDPGDFRLADILRSGPARFVFAPPDQEDPEWRQETVASRPNTMSLAQFADLVERSN